MPIYPYNCPGCGYHEDVLKFMRQCRDPEFCSCGVQMERDYKFHRSEDRIYQKPIEMFAVAPETPAQLADLRRQLPDTKFTPDLVPIAHSFAERNRILKATGYEDRSGRG